MRALPLLAFACSLFSATAYPAEVRKSVSLSRQFIVYCDDAEARARISGFAEETKKNVLALLGQSDTWKLPIVVEVKKAAASDPNVPASRVQLAQTEDGARLEVSITLGDDPGDARFEQQLVRALLLEYAYRHAPPPAGSAFVEPPAWLVEGSVGLFHRANSSAHAELFKTMMAGDRLPPLNSFLGQSTDRLAATSQAFYGTCAMCLVQLLIDLPEGRSSLSALLRNLNRDGNDATGALIRNFPVLGTTTQSLEKWWTLSMARLSTAERYQGLGLAESEAQLAAILAFEIAGRDGAPWSFTLDQFDEFRKLPASRKVMESVDRQLLALGLQASPLFRPIITSYREIARQLARGKTHGVKNRLASAAQYRELLLTRIDQIADYLNWFEATQQTFRTDSFDSYFKTAREIAREGSGREDPISRYLDVVQRQMQ